MGLDLNHRPQLRWRPPSVTVMARRPFTEVEMLRLDIDWDTMRFRRIQWERWRRPGCWRGFVDGWWRFEVGPTEWNGFGAPVGPWWPTVRGGCWPTGKPASYDTLEHAQAACEDVLEWEER